MAFFILSVLAATINSSKLPSLLPTKFSGEFQVFLSLRVFYKYAELRAHFSWPGLNPAFLVPTQDLQAEPACSSLLSTSVEMPLANSVLSISSQMIDGLVEITILSTRMSASLSCLNAGAFEAGLTC